MTEVSTITVKDANGASRDVATLTALIDLLKGDYATVPASQTDYPLSDGSSPTDLMTFIAGLLIVPASTSPGAVTIKDGNSGTPITVFAGGANSVSNLVPFPVPLGILATSDGWLVTTGANVSVLASGSF